MDLSTLCSQFTLLCVIIMVCGKVELLTGNYDIDSTPPRICMGRNKGCSYKISVAIGYVTSASAPVVVDVSRAVDLCEAKCVSRDWCELGVVYRNSSGSMCHLYRSGIVIQTKLGAPTYGTVFIKSCCKYSRCRSTKFHEAGFWRISENATSIGAALETKTVSLRLHCLQFCRENELCWTAELTELSPGRGFRCAIKRRIKTTDIVGEKSSKYRTYMWENCKFKPPNVVSVKEWLRSPTKCNGTMFYKGLIHTVGMTTNATQPPIVAAKYDNAMVMYAPTHRGCVAACATNPACTAALFNASDAKCALLGVTPCVRSVTTAWHAWEWRCRVDTVVTQLSAAADTSKLPTRCLCSEAKNITIYLNDCNKPNFKHSFRLTNAMGFATDDSLQNVAGWLKIKLPLSWNNEISYAWVNQTDVTSCDRTYCKTDHSHIHSFNIDDDYCSDIVITRAQWGALPEKPGVENYTVTPSRVILSETVEPGPKCYHRLECASQARATQRFHQNVRGWSDIGFNALISDGGEVLEARGLDKVGAHCHGFNHDSIGISFFGWHEQRLPPQRAITALRRWLECAVKQHKLTADYKIFTYRELRGAASPGQALFDAIRTFPPYHKNNYNTTSVVCSVEIKSSVIRTRVFVCAAVLALIAVAICGIGFFVIRSSRAKLYTYTLNWKLSPPCQSAGQTLNEHTSTTQLFRKDSEFIEFAMTRKALPIEPLKGNISMISMISSSFEQCYCYDKILAAWRNARENDVCAFVGHVIHCSAIKECQCSTLVTVRVTLFRKSLIFIHLPDLVHFTEVLAWLREENEAQIARDHAYYVTVQFLQTTARKQCTSSEIQPRKISTGSTDTSSIRQHMVAESSNGQVIDIHHWIERLRRTNMSFQDIVE